MRRGLVNLLKYQIRPLPDNPRELEELATGLRVSLAYTYRHHGLDTALAQARVRKALAAFRFRVFLVLALVMALAVAVRYLEYKPGPLSPTYHHPESRRSLARGRRASTKILVVISARRSPRLGLKI
jgi:hypothetical protein